MTTFLYVNSDAAHLKQNADYTFEIITQNLKNDNSTTANISIISLMVDSTANNNVIVLKFDNGSNNSITSNHMSPCLSICSDIKGGAGQWRFSSRGKQADLETSSNLTNMKFHFEDMLGVTIDLTTLKFCFIMKIELDEKRQGQNAFKL